MSSFSLSTRARQRQTEFPTQEAPSGGSVDVTNTVSTNVNNTVSVTFSGTLSSTISGVVSAQFFAGPTGGYTPSTSTALSTAAFTITPTTGTLGGWFIGNPNTTGTFGYVQMFDTATVTVGTTTPTMILSIPGGAAANLQPFIAFTTAIKAAAATTPTGSTSLTSALVASFWYK